MRWWYRDLEGQVVFVSVVEEKELRCKEEDRRKDRVRAEFLDARSLDPRSLVPAACTRTMAESLRRMLRFIPLTRRGHGVHAINVSVSDRLNAVVAAHFVFRSVRSSNAWLDAFLPGLFDLARRVQPWKSTQGSRLSLINPLTGCPSSSWLLKRHPESRQHWV